MIPLTDAQVVAALSRQPDGTSDGVLTTLNARDVATVVLRLEDAGQFWSAAVVRTLFLSAGVGAEQLRALRQASG